MIKAIVSKPEPKAAPARRARKVNASVPVASKVDGLITVTRTRYGTALGHKEEKVDVPLFLSAHGSVTVAGSVTRNVGDHNFVRVEVSVTIPCYPEESEIDRAKHFASTKVDQFISEEIAVATSTGI